MRPTTSRERPVSLSSALARRPVVRVTLHDPQRLKSPPSPVQRGPCPGAGGSPSLDNGGAGPLTTRERDARSPADVPNVPLRPRRKRTRGFYGRSAGRRGKGGPAARFTGSTIGAQRRGAVLSTVSARSAGASPGATRRRTGGRRAGRRYVGGRRTAARRVRPPRRRRT